MHHAGLYPFQQTSILKEVTSVRKTEAWLGTRGLQKLTNPSAKSFSPGMSEAIMTNCIISPNSGILLKVTGV